MLARAAMTAMLDRHLLQGLTCVHTVALVRQHLWVVVSVLTVLLGHLLEKVPQSATNVQKALAITLVADHSALRMISSAANISIRLVQRTPLTGANVSVTKASTQLSIENTFYDVGAEMHG